MNMQLSPKQIVSELDKYIIGQEKAKKALSVASPASACTSGNCRHHSDPQIQKTQTTQTSQNVLMIHPQEDIP